MHFLIMRIIETITICTLLLLPSGEVACICEDVPALNERPVQRTAEPTSRGRSLKASRVRER